MSRWLIPAEAAVIHAAHSGLSAAKDNGAEQSWGEHRRQRKPSPLSSVSPSQLFDWRILPTLPLRASRLPPLLGVGGLGGWQCWLRSRKSIS